MKIVRFNELTTNKLQSLIYVMLIFKCDVLIK